MKTVGNILLALLLAMAVSRPAAAQRYSVGTDGIGWMSLGAVNADASIAVGRHTSLHAGAALNPWTYYRQDPDRQMQARQMNFWGGIRWWPWHVYSGWWAGLDVQYRVYNVGGMWGKRETEEADTYGGHLWGGYSMMLSEHWNLDIGVGAWGGWKKYTVYSCPICGDPLEQGSKMFILPDARLAIQLIF